MANSSQPAASCLPNEEAPANPGETWVRETCESHDSDTLQHLFHVRVKVSFQEDLYAFSVKDTCTWHMFRAKCFNAVGGLTDRSFTAAYVDEDGDHVALFKEASYSSLQNNPLLWTSERVLKVKLTLLTTTSETDQNKRWLPSPDDAISLASQQARIRAATRAQWEQTLGTTSQNNRDATYVRFQRLGASVPWYKDTIKGFLSGPCSKEYSKFTPAKMQQVLQNRSSLEKGTEACRSSAEFFLNTGNRWIKKTFTDLEVVLEKTTFAESRKVLSALETLERKLSLAARLKLEAEQLQDIEFVEHAEAITGIILEYKSVYTWFKDDLCVKLRRAAPLCAKLQAALQDVGEDHDV